MGDLVSLTYQQKLEALSLRFYQGLKWTPKAGDYYTTSRADLELYQVVEVEDGQVKTRYCDTNRSDAVSSWPVDEFTDSGFGPKRVWVPDFVLAIPAEEAAPSTVEEALAQKILAELMRARTKFPGKNVTFAALVEEVGELATATFEESANRVEKEAVQVAVMAMRMVLDGDHCFEEWRRDKGLDALDPNVRALTEAIDG